MKRNLTTATYFAAILLIVSLIYLPGLRGPFVLDDGENISLNQAIALKELNAKEIAQAWLANDSGPLKRPLASISFAMNYYFAGSFENTLAFKVTNLTIHMVNIILVYFLVMGLVRTPALATQTSAYQHHIAGLTAALWAVHPIQLTNVLYVVQRMNSLSALFVITGLLIYMHGRRILADQRPGGFRLMFTGMFVGMLFGIMAKENAALLPLFAFVTEFTLYRQNRSPVKTRRFLWLFYSVAVGIPAILFFVYLVANPSFIVSSYAARDFTMVERLLTESRILWFYISLLFFPSASRLGLFHDDISYSTSLFSPITTILAIIGLGCAFIFALAKVKRFPVVSFAILWFLAGHLLESSIFNLELAYEHRNYLPSLGILFAVSYLLSSFFRMHSSVTRTGVILPYAVILVLGFATWNQADAWKNIQNLAGSIVAHHPDSPRANDFASRVSLNEKNDITTAIGYTLRGLDIAPREVGFQIDLQVLLANLTVEINNAAVKSAIKNNQNITGGRIQGLSDRIGVGLKNGEINLVYPESTDLQVSQLLITRPISVHGIIALENLRRCVVNPPHICQSLQNKAINWLTAASSNTQTTREYRGIILSDTAILYASRGDYNHALEYMNQAANTSSHMLSYQLAKAEYLIRLNRLNDAKIMLNQFTKVEPTYDIQFSVNKETINKLVEMYNKAILSKPNSASSTKNDRLSRHQPDIVL
jgi:tetratricopeptide (TPR) repeat protein